MPESMKSYQPWSPEHGAGYTAADGGKVYEKGKQAPIVKFENGPRKKMQLKVSKDNKALGSIKDLRRAGNRVIFDEDGSHIQNKKKGETIKLYGKNNTHVFKVDRDQLQD